MLSGFTNTKSGETRLADSMGLTAFTLRPDYALRRAPRCDPCNPRRSATCLRGFVWVLCKPIQLLPIPGTPLWMCGSLPGTAFPLNQFMQMPWPELMAQGRYPQPTNAFWRWNSNQRTNWLGTVRSVLPSALYVLCI